MDRYLVQYMKFPRPGAAQPESVQAHDPAAAVPQEMTTKDIRLLQRKRGKQKSKAPVLMKHDM